LTKDTPPKLTPEQYAARFNAEKALLARGYCDGFKFWRSCRLKFCRRARRCSGEPMACVKRSAAEIPRDIQWRARQEVLALTPANVGPPERTARELMPGSF
jgi:hypothetical protein